jgi:hypothetical protein
MGGMKMAELDPVSKSQDADRILSSIQEWMIQQAASPTNGTEDTDKSEVRKETSLSPSIAPAEPSIQSSSSVPPGRPFDPSQERKSSPVTSNELFVRMRLVRTVVGVLLIAVIVGAAWLTYRDNETRNTIKASVYRLTSSFSATPRESRTPGQSSTELSDQAAKTPTTTSVQANNVAELKQQVLALVSDLAVMRRDVEQLSGKQEQLSRDIATVQATEQNVSEKISTLTQPAPTLSQPAPILARPAAPTHGEARKNVPRVVHPETPKQPDAPVTTSSIGTSSLTEQPPRPPLPVPAIAETPSPLH